MYSSQCYCSCYVQYLTHAVSSRARRAAPVPKSGQFLVGQWRVCSGSARGNEPGPLVPCCASSHELSAANIPAFLECGQGELDAAQVEDHQYPTEQHRLRGSGMCKCAIPPTGPALSQHGRCDQSAPPAPAQPRCHARPRSMVDQCTEYTEWGEGAARL